MRDDVAFQSQQFGEQVAQRRDRYAQQNIQTWNQLPDTVSRFQQSMSNQQAIQSQQQQMVRAQQAHEVDMARSAEQLGLDQLRTQSAMAELQWARELHTTDMIAAQKESQLAQTELVKAQTKKALRDLEAPEFDDIFRMTPREQIALRASGIDVTISGGKAMAVQADPNVQKEAKALNDQFIQAELKSTQDRYAMRNQDWLPEQRESGVVKARSSMIQDSIKNMEVELQQLNEKMQSVKSRDPLASKKKEQIQASIDDIEKKLFARRRQHAQYVDQALSGESSDVKPDETPELLIRDAMTQFRDLPWSKPR